MHKVYKQIYLLELEVSTKSLPDSCHFACEVLFVNLSSARAY